MAENIKEVLLEFESLKRDVYLLKEGLKFMVTTLNKDLGKMQPNAEYRRDGFQAYANGTDWNPGSGKGIYRYNSATSSWVLVG